MSEPDSLNVEPVSAGAQQSVPRGRLRILSGVQKGAGTTLASGESVRIGRAADNDLILRDPSVADERIQLHVLNGAVRVEVLSGEISIDGIACAQGDRLELPELSLLQTGNVIIQIESPGGGVQTGEEANLTGGSSVQQTQATVSSTAHKSDDSAESVEESTGHDAGVNQTAARGAEAMQTYANSDRPAAMDSVSIAPGEEPDAESGKEAASVSNLTSRLLGLATLGIVLIGAYTFAQGIFQHSSDEPTRSLVETLADSPFNHLHLEQSDQAAVLTGFVDTEREAVELDQWLVAHGIQLDNNVLVSETLGNQVKEVFRVNGVKAELSALHNGAIDVSTSVVDEQQLARIEAMVLADVPGIASLNIVNTPPPEDAQMQGPVDPGKRVALVVSDEPAYIVTVDQSRYFVGSILPNGQRIVSIEDGKVSTSKDGEMSTLEF